MPQPAVKLESPPKKPSQGKTETKSPPKRTSPEKNSGISQTKKAPTEKTEVKSPPKKESSDKTDNSSTDAKEDYIISSDNPYYANIKEFVDKKSAIVKNITATIHNINELNENINIIKIERNKFRINTSNWIAKNNDMNAVVINRREQSKNLLNMYSQYKDIVNKGDIIYNKVIDDMKANLLNLELKMPELKRNNIDEYNKVKEEHKNKLSKINGYKKSRDESMKTVNMIYNFVNKIIDIPDKLKPDSKK